MRGDGVLVLTNTGGGLDYVSPKIGGWYHRLVRNPDVELVVGDEVRPYRAVPLDDPASEANMKRLIEERVGRVRAGVIRTILLFAEVKPVRLDPR